MPARKRPRPVPLPDEPIDPILTSCASCGDEGRWFPEMGIVVHRPLRKCVVQHVEAATAYEAAA